MYNRPSELQVALNGGEAPRIYKSHSQQRSTENIQVALNGGEAPELPVLIHLMYLLVHSYYMLFRRKNQYKISDDVN